ncbi:MAG: hypothetical protein H6Q23_1655 [Bacteroidetes bacterium]|nr:hypothetical protein [Bacteroidota bacterium]
MKDNQGEIIRVGGKTNRWSLLTSYPFMKTINTVILIYYQISNPANTGCKKAGNQICNQDSHNHYWSGCGVLCR